MNAVEIEEAVSALAAQPFDPAEFPFSFLEAFGAKDTTVRRLRKGETNASDVLGAVLQHKNIHLAVCQPGEAGQTLKALHDSPKTASQKAKFILATDGDTVEAKDLATGETIASAYRDFASHFGFFLPLAGISTVKEIKDNPIDVRATGRLNKLYIELLKHNPEWSTEARRHDLNHFMARLIFCFFAEDTQIILNKLFTRTVEQMSARDSSNTHEVIGRIFQAMNTRPVNRAASGLPGWADSFPYVNGGLFSGSMFSTLPADLPLGDLVHLAKHRWIIERDYEELKQELGLGHFEGRGWRGFHHHATLCIISYGFLVAERSLFSPSARAGHLGLRAAKPPQSFRSRGSPRTTRAA